MVKLPKELQQNKKGPGPSRINKKCSIEECGEFAIRSLSKQKWESYAERANLKLKKSKDRNFYLCKVHYKAANKYRKSAEKLTRKNIFTENTRYGIASKKKAISPWDK